jgi:hypothetical protein
VTRFLLTLLLASDDYETRERAAQALVARPGIRLPVSRDPDMQAWCWEIRYRRGQLPLRDRLIEAVARRDPSPGMPGDWKAVYRRLDTFGPNHSVWAVVELPTVIILMTCPGTYEYVYLYRVGEVPVGVSAW